MATRFREYNGEEYLRKGQALAYIGNQSGQYKGDKWLYARVRNGRLTKYEIDGKPYYKRSELDALLTPQVVERHDPPYSELDYMTMGEFADKVGLSYSSVSKLRREGKIKAINVSHNTGRSADYRIHRDDYMRWVEERWLEQQQQEKVGAGAR